MKVVKIIKDEHRMVLITNDQKIYYRNLEFAPDMTVDVDMGYIERYVELHGSCDVSVMFVELLDFVEVEVNMGR